MIPKTLEEHLELTFAHLSTPFAKLAFLAVVRDPYTGKYVHEGWTSISSPEQIHEVLRAAHREVFEFLCSLSMTQVCGELADYLHTPGSPLMATVRVWSELEVFRDLVPQGICVEERDFFVSQMQIALEVLAIAPNWAPMELASWRFLPPDQRFRHHLGN